MALKLANSERRRANTAAQRELQQRRTAQRQLYPNLISRAQQALSPANLLQAKSYLDQIVLPSDPAADPRGFDWRYTAGLCHDASERTFGGSQDSIEAIAFSPDGRCLAEASADHQIRLRDAQTGWELAHFGVQTQVNRCLLFSPDGRALLVGLAGRTLVWDVEARRERDNLEAQTSQGQPLMVTSLAWSPDGSTLACGLHSGAIDLWDVAKHRKKARLLHNASADNSSSHFAVNGLDFSRDGKLLASGCGDFDGSQAVKLWKTADWSYMATLGVAAKGGAGWGRVNSVAFSPDSAWLVTASEDQVVRVWNVASRSPNSLNYHVNNVTGVAFSREGRWLATSSDDGTLRLWDAGGMARGDRPREAGVLYGHAQAVKCVAFSPDGKMLASGSRDKTIKLWNPARLARPVFQAHDSIIGTLAYSPDGRLIATAAHTNGSYQGDSVVRVWDARTHALIATTPAHHHGVYAAFSPDSKMLALAGDDKTLTICDARSGKETARFAGVQEWLDAVAWSPNGKWLATGGRAWLTSKSGQQGHHPRLWSVAERREIEAFADHQGHIGWVLSLAFSPDSKMLVSGGGEGELRWWDPNALQEIGPPPRQVQGRTVSSQFAHQQNIFALAFSPDGKYMVTGGEDNTARLWDAHTRKPIHLMLGHRDIVYAAAFSPDGKTLATGSKDGTIKVWSLATLRDNVVQDTVTLKGDREGVYSLAFSPDGGTLAAGHTSGAVVLWQAGASPQSVRLAHRN